MTSPTLLALMRDVPLDPPRFVGVYFLFDGDEIVYVGQSTDVPKRVVSHVARRQHDHERWRMTWDRACWIPLDETDLDAYEGALIRRLTPRYNTGAPSNTERDEEICAALDLPALDLVRYAEFLERRRKSFVVPGVKRSHWNRERKKAAALRRRLGVEHIEDVDTRTRRLNAIYLWRAVQRVMRKEAA